MNDEELLNDKKYIAPSHSSIERSERRIRQIGGTVKMNYYLTAYGWVKFHFYSPNPQPNEIYGYNLGSGASEIFYGQVDEYRIWDFGGNRTHEIALNKFQNGEWTNWQEPILVPAFDTLDYEVTF
ncbi:hypothetical protein [Phaeocystidibacter marisrubri]|uniref:Uncharacterized protein n=1 Tax=Phaeocystidibacter marisrubri TaxID=1577780 RepID=A0A6L3ZEJ7_9FLAO|nr:hypothetical protein [Phaeocystidibacter marisrubri]KAB2816253.1 hypothetical protein F8C82_11235 [Phaeocystidibacter marisrubri]GGH68087.1 hypothetical protein GCM10011318_07760 [Phaeocystidibacter marisrubri]